MVHIDQAFSQLSVYMCFLLVMNRILYLIWGSMIIFCMIYGAMEEKFSSADINSLLQNRCITENPQGWKLGFLINIKCRIFTILSWKQCCNSIINEFS